jgi:hypothetical protein
MYLFIYFTIDLCLSVCNCVAAVALRVTAAISVYLCIHQGLASALAAWHSGHRVRQLNRRSRV